MRAIWASVAGLLLALAVQIAPAAAKPGTEQVSLALRLMEVSGVSENTRQAIDVGLQTAMLSNPQAAQLTPAQREIVVQAVREVFDANIDRMLNDIAALYAATLTAEEMRASIAFYETPEGAALVRKTPALMASASQIGLEFARRLAPQIEKRVQELAGRAKPNKT